MFLCRCFQGQGIQMAIILVWGGCGSHFQNGWYEFSMSHISANNIDKKLIIVSTSMFSWSRNPNMAITLVCGGCGSHFKNGWHEFSMSHISANNGDRNLMLMWISVFRFHIILTLYKHCFFLQNGVQFELYIYIFQS